MSYVTTCHKVFLTDILGSHIADIFDNLMFSVVPAYFSMKRFINYRKRFNGRIAYDSGGYQFLLGKIKDPPDPNRTIYVYKMLGFTDRDFLIQLDLPPAYLMSKQERLDLIRRSAEFYHVMRRELNVLGVVHGWTFDELQYSLQLLEDCNGKIAAGTYAATSVIASHAAQAEMVLQRTPRRVIFERLVNVSWLLKDYEIFMLGCSNPNIIHIAFLLGSKYCDGGSWRIAAAHGVIFIPEHGRFSIGRKRVSKRLTDYGLLKKYYEESPFEPSFKEFLSMLKNDFKTRALWNAWVLKYEEEIANLFTNNPEKYYKYLLRRFSRSKFWLNVLNFVWNRYKQKYVQTDLRIFLKTDFNTALRKTEVEPCLT